MNNDTFIHIPGVRDYLERKESNLRSKYFRKYMTLHTELSLILLFQSETLKHIRQRYGITTSDFKVLTAARLYSLSERTLFRPYQLCSYLKGMWSEQVYKSFRNLLRKGLISRYEVGKVNSYHISREGDSCLKSYAKVFDEVFQRYIDEVKEYQL